LGWLTARTKRLERLLGGKPRILVRHGKVCKEVVAREQITHSELVEALRREGHTALTQVRYAILENDGYITIGLRGHRDE
jgi:uncharacterized membrane protein YcaP (DUF421 family)